jgi:hypothetical protein
MKLDPKIWIPKLQFMLITISLYYPLHPNDISKKKYYDFITNLPVFFPDIPLGNDFIKLLDEFPVTPYLKSRESFMKWVHFINNKINITMDYEQKSFYESLESYYDYYKPEEIRKKEYSKRKKQYIQLGIVFFIILTIVYHIRNQS